MFYFENLLLPNNPSRMVMVPADTGRLVLNTKHFEGLCQKVSNLNTTDVKNES